MKSLYALEFDSIPMSFTKKLLELILEAAKRNISENYSLHYTRMCNFRNSGRKNLRELYENVYVELQNIKGPVMEGNKLVADLILWQNFLQ